MLVPNIEHELKEATNQVIEMVYFIKTGPLKSKIFELLCMVMNSRYVRLLLYTDVRWLSKGNVLFRVIELQKELIFLKMKNLIDFVNTIKMNCGCLK